MDSTTSLLTSITTRDPCPDFGTELSRRGLYSTGFTRAHVMSLAFVLLAFVVMPMDVPVACYLHSVHTGQLPYWFCAVEKMCNLSEIISHGQGVLIVLLGIMALDRARRRSIPRLLACSLLAGLLAALCKSLIVRVRPAHFAPEYLAGHATESFGRWLPFLTDDLVGSHLKSFPSAHTATAIGLAIGLSWLYPHARWYFFVLAFLAACQRVVVEAHYISDVLAGCAVGSAFALLCTGPGHLGRLFSRLERSRQGI